MKKKYIIASTILVVVFIAALLPTKYAEVYKRFGMKDTMMHMSAFVAITIISFIVFRKSFALALLVVIGINLITEICQGVFTNSRSFSRGDIICNFIGSLAIAIPYGTYKLWAFWRKSRTVPALKTPEIS